MVNPILFDLGPIEIRYYGVLYALAFLVGYFILRKLARKFNIKEEYIDDYMPYIIIADIVGARLFEVLFYNSEYYFANPLKIFAVWEGGLASHGAIITIILATIWFCKKRKILFYNFADMISIPIALGAAFIRIGNFINSELVGKITDLPWAVQFLGYEGSRHPVQIYQATGHVIIFFILLSMTKLKNIKEGTIFWSLLFIDSIFRFVTEFYKDLPADYGFVYLGLNLAQWASLVIIMVSIKPLYDRFKLLK
ncbi:prolipoprotein diacylglyceryl transferase [Candidatus Woesearchaeota archaeon]|nr:prolipoprotein diacylglyceryl transferase [Candidatus Woesearchaeota archaeon]